VKVRAAPLLDPTGPGPGRDVDELLAAAGLPPPPGSHPVAAPTGELTAWAASGGMALTGWPDQAPLPPPAPVLGRLGAVTAAIAAVTSRLGDRVDVDLPVTLFGRAALLAGRRAGTTSVGGSCQLLPAADGWLALNLPRWEDAEAVPALVGRAVTDPWGPLGGFARSRPAADAAARAQELGIPAAALGEAGDARVRARRLGAPAAVRSRPLVVDLSALWAGPVVAHVLGRAGARVVKVETPERPDGARRGPRAFFDWLHAGHESAAWDFTTPDGSARLRALLRRADVVIEASRPRALRQLGLDAEELVAERPGRTWLSITAYGRGGPWSNRVGFGDDVAAAAGLVARDPAGVPVFCGDAIADPVTGLVAALATLTAVAAGGGYLLDVSLAAATAFVGRPAAPLVPELLPLGPGRWAVRDGAGEQEVLAPRPPTPLREAEPLGASTAVVLGELGDADARR
jgi:hypothetical protein